MLRFLIFHHLIFYILFLCLKILKNVVKAMVQKQQLNHPVLWDMNCRNHRNYGLKTWPVAYLIDTHGKVFWEGNPARVVNRRKATAELKKLIEEKLRAVKTTRKAAAQQEHKR